MAALDIPYIRLSNQRLAQSSFETPAEVVAWLGAVQAQDYAAAKWALALRAPGLTDAAVDRAQADGSILRTHVLRPTWHFVTPADIRWLLALTAPRVHAFNASYYRKMGLDLAVFDRSNTALAQVLQGGKQLTRPELEAVLQQAGLPTDELRFTLMIMHAELDGLLCSGPRRGKQFTYALLDDRVPPSSPIQHDEALAALALRYFTSHGPATLADFAWWSGLTAADARRALEMVASQLRRETIETSTCWFAEPHPPHSAPDHRLGEAAAGVKDDLRAYLLPCYDEYTVAYTDRSAVSVGIDLAKLDPRSQGPLNYIIVIDGQFAGTWRRTLKKRAVVVELNPFAPLSADAKHAVSLAAQRYATFLALPLDLQFSRPVVE